MREDPGPTLTRRRPAPAVIYRSETPQGFSRLAVAPGAARLSLAARVYFRFEAVQEILRAFLEKTDPQGPDTLGELIRAIWHRLTGDTPRPAPAPGQHAKTVQEPELTMRAAAKISHALILAVWAVACAAAHRLRQLADTH
jgi:hypothetical protein